MELGPLALSRSAVDRAAHLRSDEPFLEALAGPDEVLVLPLVAGRGPVTDGPEGSRLVLLPGKDVLAALVPVDPAAAGSPVGVLLGVEDDRRYGAVLIQEEPGPAFELPAGTRWAGLREAGSTLDDAGAGLLTAAVALSAWHRTHPRCPRCGHPTTVVKSGWVRWCPVDRVEHFPRTDPAVIMAVTDPDDRILLGRQAVWPEGRYSTLAGFVEAGESLEAAVRREVAEETGIVVGDVTYRGNQPWPFPSSLMLGFSGRALTTEVQVDGDELADARFWTRDELVADVAAGTLLLPPGVSIARRLVEDWFGGPIEAEEAWR